MTNEKTNSRFRAIPVRPGLLALLLLPALSACDGLGANNPGSVAQAEDPLYQTANRHGAVWPSTSSIGPTVIPVCLKCSSSITTEADCDQAKQDARATLESTYERHTRIDFQEFGDCPASKGWNIGYMVYNLTNDPGGRTYRVYRDDTGAIVEENRSGYAPDREIFMSTYKDSDYVLHETGHGLGFEHEYYRDDGVGITCMYHGEDLNLQNASGTKISPDYDKLSIMNATYCRKKGFRGLSAKDVAGIQTVYGRPWSDTLVNAGTGECLRASAFAGGLTTAIEARGCNGDAATQGFRYGDNAQNEPFAFRSTVAGREKDVLQLNSGGPDLVVSRNNLGGRSTQRFHFTEAQIVGLGNLCVTVSDVPQTGERVSMENCDNNNPGQHWDISTSTRSGYYTIKSLADQSLCLRLSSAQGSGEMSVLSCTSGAEFLRQWKLGYGEQTLKVAKGGASNSHVCADMRDGIPDYGQAADGKACSGEPRQQWSLRGKLKNDSTGTCLTQDWTTRAVSVATCDQGSSQTWDYYP